MKEIKEINFVYFKYSESLDNPINYVLVQLTPPKLLSYLVQITP
jgi:hypothetical protein